MLSLILGLGNIGKKYVGTRHNVGFEVVDRVADLLKASPQPRVKEYDWLTAETGERLVILAKPRTYMNLSGLAAARLLEEHSLIPSQMLVIVDDLVIPLGTVRIRGKGSAGGHNGLLSIVEEIGTQSFSRMRLGIGKLDSRLCGNDKRGEGTGKSRERIVSEGARSEQLAAKPVDNEPDIVDFVLSRFDPGERLAVDKMIHHAADAVLFAIAHRLDETMSKYNVNPALPDPL
jgi:PTH1 family peptidyl-tRNA hydrolase